MLAEARRRELLGALGIDVYVPRGTAAGPGAVLVVVCAEPDPRAARTQPLRQILPNALGIDASRILWIPPQAALPPAAACLAFGADSLAARDAQLSTMQQNGGVVAIAGPADTCLAGPDARRALWQALKPIARRLRGES